MSSSNPNPNNNAAARRGYPAADSFQHSQGNNHQHHHHHSGLRRSHLYGSRATTVFNSLTSGNGGDTDQQQQQQTRPTSATYSRIDGARTTATASHTNPSRPTAAFTQPTSTLPTASEYFAREATSTGPAQPQSSQSPIAPWARPGSRFASKQIRTAHATSSYGLPPTPESDVSVSRVTTPPRQPRDYQFNVEMMQRMTQHAKISPLNHYDHLKRELAEENLVVDGGNVDRLVARAGERILRGHEGTPGPGAEQYPSGRRVAFRSPEAVEGAREASRRLNGLSATLGRPSSMYEVASKPAEPNPTSNMYDELKRTLSESSSERPKRVVRQPASTRQLPPLSPVQKRHVEVRPRRPVATASTAHAPSPSQRQNEYYQQQETRPRTAPSQDDPITNIDWLAAAQDVVDTSPRKTNNRRRPRTLSSLSNTAWPSRKPDEFGGELRPDSADARVRLSSAQSTSQPAEASKPSRPEPQPSMLNQLPSAALSNSYLQHNLVDFVSEDDLTLNLSSENRPPVAFDTSFRSTHLGTATTSRRPATSSGKLQEVSFLQSTNKTDPDETLDTLRQLSRLLSGNTPAKQDAHRMAEPTPSEPVGLRSTIVKSSAAADSRQPYKRQARPLASRQGTGNSETPKAGHTPKPVRPGPSQGTSLTSVLNAIAKKNQDGLMKPASSSARPGATPRKTSGSQTPTSKAIQFDDGYETDDSLDRLLTNDTDYASLLKPATFEDESFLHGTVQVAKRSQVQKPNDLEALALRTKVLNNLQTVQLDIRETRRGLENIERKFGMLEDDGMFKPSTGDTSTTAMQSGAKPALAPRRYVFVPRKKKAGKGLFRRPWVFKDYFFAFLFLVLGLLAIEYKLWSDTIIPQYSRVSSDEWFAKHPVGSYRPGGTFRAVFSVFLWFGNVGIFFVQQVSTGVLWARTGIDWLASRVTTAASPLPADVQFPLHRGGATASSSAGITTTTTNTNTNTNAVGTTTTTATTATSQGCTWRPQPRAEAFIRYLEDEGRRAYYHGDVMSLYLTCHGVNDTVVAWWAVHPRAPEYVLKTCVWRFLPAPDGTVVDVPREMACFQERTGDEISWSAEMLRQQQRLCGGR
ncbi:hypothetical protein Dda_1900 [Drechslerella dactyloides]|uniref:Uncharacterized protein n=1 Tax=Drechslerella dactyloides TaxID=74499 RepID=A0AAD6J6T7_DREDA|nr:hypothetical protein Dda_1900 [Drechslerella dactyloides]